MSHFKNDGGGGDERLYISTSPDGLHWTALNSGQPVYQPPNWAGFTNVVRDPTIIYDNGTYWVAYTSGNYGKHASFGLAKSTDLLNWTYVGEISTALPGQTDPLTWNPCFFRDGDGSVHVFVSISPINGSSYDPLPAMRSYEIHPVSADWTVWSTPVLVNLPSNNTNELWVWKEGTVYHGIYVDWNSNAAQIHVTSSDLINGWGNPQHLGFDSQEGAFMLKYPQGGLYRLYLEVGNTNGAQGTYLVCDVSSSFTSATAQVSVTSDVPMRNGKVTLLPSTTTYSMWSAAHLSSQSTVNQVPTADPDGDGLSNALEYAFDLLPGNPDRSLASQAGWSSNGNLTLTFRELPSLSDVTYTIESSSDLVYWNAASGMNVDSFTMMTDGTEQVVAEDLTQPSTTPAHFLRLNISLAATQPAPSGLALSPAVRTVSTLTTAARTKQTPTPKPTPRVPPRPPVKPKTLHLDTPSATIIQRSIPPIR